MRTMIHTQQRNALLYFMLIILINLSVLSIIITGIALGIKGYVSDTWVAFEDVTCCGSICAQCFFTLQTIFTILPWACIAILLTGACVAVYKAIILSFRNCRYVRALTPLSIEDRSELKNILSATRLHEHCVLFDNNETRYAFTSGILRPKIYLSSGMCSYLTSSELFAVILHESHHKRNYDPLKLVIVQFLTALNYFLPINRYLVKQYTSASEKAADDSAINFSGEPLELASALVKLSQCNAMRMARLSTAFNSEQGVVEERIRRLLETQTQPPCFRNTYLFLSGILSLFVAGIMCLSLFARSFDHLHTIGCKTTTCHITKCG